MIVSLLLLPFQKMRRNFLYSQKKKEKDDDEYTFSAYTHSSPCHGRNDCITTTLNKPKHSTTYSVNIQVISTPQSWAEWNCSSSFSSLKEKKTKVMDASKSRRRGMWCFFCTMRNWMSTCWDYAGPMLMVLGTVAGGN
jgi:hypothetical protein